MVLIQGTGCYSPDLVWGELYPTIKTNTHRALFTVFLLHSARDNRRWCRVHIYDYDQKHGTRSRWPIE
jgi:hypothetical protein